VLRDYQRYRHYLDANFSDTERLRFACLQQLLVVQAAVLALNLLFLGLDAALNFSYNTTWNFYVAQGFLIYGLLVVGLQANYAAASSPLLFGVARPQPLASGELPALAPEPMAELEISAREAAMPEEAMGLPADLWPWRAKLLALLATERP